MNGNNEWIIFDYDDIDHNVLDNRYILSSYSSFESYISSVPLYMKRINDANVTIKHMYHLLINFFRISTSFKSYFGLLIIFENIKIIINTSTVKYTVNLALICHQAYSFDELLYSKLPHDNFMYLLELFYRKIPRSFYNMYIDDGRHNRYKDCVIDDDIFIGCKNLYNTIISEIKYI